ncbi:hypothetical protein ACRRTK_015509 [Alexandromys fortis]
MSGAPPSYCFVALPPRAKDGLVVFGKNSARPRDEVQEVVYFPAVDHEAESKVESCDSSLDKEHATHDLPFWRTETSELAILQFFHVYSQFITILLGLETGTDAALFLFVIVCKIHADLRAILILAYVPLKRAPVFIFKSSPVQSGDVALLSIPRVVFVLG